MSFKYERFCCLAIFMIDRFLNVQGENLQLDSALLSVETATRCIFIHFVILCT